MRLKVGQVLNVKSRTFYGMLIGWRNSLIYGKGHNWTHSAIVTEVREDKILIHEALGNGFVSKYHSRKEVEEKIENEEYINGTVKRGLLKVKENADKYLGRGYGFLDILHIIIYWIFGTNAKFLFTGAQNLICSEAVSRILYDASNRRVNFEKEYGIPFDLIEPMHLWQSNQIKWNDLK
jgi:hypothetical protein